MRRLDTGSVVILGSSRELVANKALQTDHAVIRSSDLHHLQLRFIHQIHLHACVQYESCTVAKSMSYLSQTNEVIIICVLSKE